jgi:hypothetical protein
MPLGRARSRIEHRSRTVRNETPVACSLRATSSTRPQVPIPVRLPPRSHRTSTPISRRDRPTAAASLRSPLLQKLA